MIFASLLPTVETYEAEQRFRHQDIAALPDERIGAELHLLTTLHAQLVLEPRRSYLPACDGSGLPIAALDWTHDRVERLRAEQRRRRKERAS